MGMLQYYENETPKYVCTLTDGATNQYPQAFVYNYDLTAKETVDLTHNAKGQYIGTAASTYDKGNYSVVYIVYSDSGHTTPNTDYWQGEDNLDVLYKPYGGYGGGGGVQEIDWEKLINKFWKHETAKKIIDLLEKIKKIVSGITDNKVIKAIKGIKMPVFKAEKVDLTPIMKEFNKLTETLTKQLNDKIDSIEIPTYDESKISDKVDILDYSLTLNRIVELVERIEKFGNKLELTDYGVTLNKIIVLLEKVDSKDNSKQIEELKLLIKNL